MATGAATGPATAVRLHGALAADERDPAGLAGLAHPLLAHPALEEEHLLPVLLRGPSGPAGPAALDPHLRARLVEGVPPEVVAALDLQRLSRAAAGRRPRPGRCPVR